MRLLIIIISFFIVACTNNPLFDEDTSAQDKYVLRGKIALDDGSSPGDLFVWMEELDLSTRTNTAGDFLLQIPKNDELKGLNGVYKIYFYAGDYKITHVEVLLRDGHFEYGQYAINNQGYIKETIILKKILLIETTIDPMTISGAQSTFLEITVTFTAVDTTLLILIERGYADRQLAGFVFNDLSKSILDAILYSRPGAVRVGYNLDSAASTWEVSFSLPENLLPSGEYEVYPFVSIRQKTVPEALLANFGAKADEFTTDFLNVPLKPKSARLTVN